MDIECQSQLSLFMDATRWISVFRIDKNLFGIIGILIEIAFKTFHI